MARPMPDSWRKNPSFAVTPETGAWYCHSKCGRGGSVPRTRELLGAPRERPKPQRARIGATYDYLDEAGELLFQACATNPRMATSADRMAAAGGSTIFREYGVCCSRLPTLPDAATVLIAEGEKGCSEAGRSRLCGHLQSDGAGSG